MDERTRRIGENEALFREVNERINDLNETFGTISDFHIVCECGMASCMERIQLPGDEYSELRADPVQFAVIPGHVAPEAETVVASRDGYDIVRKREGGPARLAERTAR